MPFLAALLPALIAGGAGFAGSLISANAANKASQNASDTAKRAEGYIAPYREAGTGALDPLSAAYGTGDPGTLAARRAQLDANFTSSPLYKYTYQPAVDQAVKEAERSGSAGGYLDSGRTLMAIQDRAARIGGQTFGSYIGGLDTQATRGANAATNQATVAQGGAQQANAYSTSAADTLGAGFLGAGSAINKGLNSYYQGQGQSAYRPAAAFNSGSPIY